MTARKFQSGDCICYKTDKMYGYVLHYQYEGFYEGIFLNNKNQYQVNTFRATNAYKIDYEDMCRSVGEQKNPPPLLAQYLAIDRVALRLVYDTFKHVKLGDIVELGKYLDQKAGLVKIILPKFEEVSKLPFKFGWTNLPK